MNTNKLVIALSLALLGPLAACSHSQAMKQTPKGPSLAQMPEEKPSRTPEPKQAEPTPPPAAEPHDNAVYFDYNSSLLAGSARSVLQRLAAQLKSNRRAELRIEGNCDERGTDEYNLALGEHRAISAKRYLRDLGVKPARIKTVSYGKEKPLCVEHDEACWAKNRRDGLLVK
jgi:peptidoglycan-associated lipoprotein